MTKFTVFIFTISALLLTSCGFKPMHSANNFGGASTGFSDIAVKSVGNKKDDFLVKQALRDRLGDNMDARYILQIEPKSSRGGLGTNRNDVESRYDLRMTTKFKLIDAKTGAVLLKDSVQAVSTYAAPRDPYGSVAAQSNATEQVSKETSDRILMRVARYYQTQESK